MLTFTSDFLWGSSTSAPQSEGTVPSDGKGENIWDYWNKKIQKYFTNKQVRKRHQLFTKTMKQVSIY